VWNAETQAYEELLGDASSVQAIPDESYDMAGLAFWRIAVEDHSYGYFGTAVDPDDLPIDSGTESPYFEIKLKEGWNHFGFPFNDIDKIDVDDLLISSNGTDFTPVTDEGNTVSQRTVWEFEDISGDDDVDDVPDDGTDYDAAMHINKGYGYWLSVNSLPGPYTEACLRILYAPDEGESDASAFAIMSVENESPPPSPPNANVAFVTSNTGGSAAGGSCFVATAAYGSALHPYVGVLREFRDAYLLTHGPGKKFVDVYYEHGPKLAHFIEKHPTWKSVTRVLLLPVIGCGAFMVYSSMALKLIVMAALIFAAVFVVRRRLVRQSLE
jgi:hypothetical protein